MLIQISEQNIMNVVTQRIHMHGFIVLDYFKEYSEGRKQLAQWVEEGKLQSKTTIVKGGLQVADKALIDIFEGKNTGMSSLRSSFCLLLC